MLMSQPCICVTMVKHQPCLCTADKYYTHTHYKFVANWNIYKEINQQMNVEHNSFLKSYVRWSLVYFFL